MRKFKNILLTMVVVATVFALTGCGDKDKKSSDESGKEKITFVLDWTPNTNHTGLYVALDKGYFDEEGLDIEVVQPPEDGAEALVGAGKAQFGVSCQDTMLAAIIGDSPMPITAVATLLQHNTSGIISRKGEGMDTPKGLEGKNYATWDLPIEKAIMKNVVEKDGGNFDKVNLIPSTVTDEVSALKTNMADAIWIFYGWAGIKAEVAGLECDYFNFKDINPVFDYYTPVIIGNDNYMAKNPETTKKFLNALKKGYEYAIANSDESIDILCKAAPELDKDIVTASQKWINDQYKAEVDRWGYIDPERWNAFYNWLSENKLVEKTVPENTGFTDDYLPE